jgi:photosystem II stability/assembly factor-like uncharacterized protein
MLGSSDGGKSWHKQKLPLGTSQVQGLSCSTATSCVAYSVGATLLTVDGGGHWTLDRMSSARRIGTLNVSPLSISCGSSTSCVGVGLGGALVTNDGGRAWTPHLTPFPVLESLLAVTCPSATTCFAIGFENVGNSSLTEGVVVKTQDGGTHWSIDGVLPQVESLNSISCLSISKCFASGRNDLGAAVIVSGA